MNTNATRHPALSSNNHRLFSTYLLSWLLQAWHLFRKTSPIFLGTAVFTVIYLQKCNHHGNLSGIDYFNQGKYAKAIISYNAFLQLYPNDLQTLYNRGRCYEVMGNDAMAESDYNRVLEYDHYHVNALLGLSQVFYRKKDYETAINLAESATLADKDNYLAYYYSARAYHKIGHWLSALKCYNSVIELNPEYGNAYFHRSSIMLSLGLRPLGCHDLKNAVELQVEGAEEALARYCTGNETASQNSFPND